MVLLAVADLGGVLKRNVSIGRDASIDFCIRTECGTTAGGDVATDFAFRAECEISVDKDAAVSPAVSTQFDVAAGLDRPTWLSAGGDTYGPAR